MTTKFTSGRIAISQCDRCGFRFKLKELKTLIIKTKNVNIKVCKECWEPDQPQLSLGLYPVNDPQAVRDPRPDIGYYEAGTSGLQISNIPSTNVNSLGFPTVGSRVIQWGWNPVGGPRGIDNPLTPSTLTMAGAVGTVSVTTT